MREFILKEKNVLFVGLGILLLSFLIRLYNINHLPIFGDEAIYIRWAQIMKAETGLRFVPLSDGKQPLFMWSVMPFLKFISDPLISGRIVSVFTGVGTTLGVGILTYLLFKSKNAALIALSIYAISPFTVFFDRMALVDSMLTFFGVWTLIFAVLTVRFKRLDYAMFTGFTLGGALLTKSPAVFFSSLIPFTLLLLLSKKGGVKKDVFKVLPLFFVTYALGYGLYNILRLGPEFHMLAIRNRDYVYPITHIFESPFDPLVTFLKASVVWFWELGPGIFIFLAIAGILSNFKKFSREVVLLSAWAFIPLFASAEFAKVFTARYVLYILPFVVVLAASFFIRINMKFTKILLLVFIVHASIVSFRVISNVESAPLPRTERSGYLEEWTAGTGIKETSEYIRLQYTNDTSKKIVVGTEGYFGTLPDGLQAYLNDVPDITVIGTGLDFTEIPNSLIESKNAGNRTYFLVNDSRLKIDYNELKLELIAAYPKAFRKEGTREYNVLGPRETLYLFEVRDTN